MYSTSILKYARIKNGLFVKQGVPHNDSSATHAYHCSVQFFTFGNDSGATKKKIKYVQKKQNAAVHDQSASFRNLIGESLDFRWRQSENCIVLFGEIQQSFDLLNDRNNFVESKIRNYCEGSN